MLSNIQIENFAIIDQLNVDFTTGMTVLTGETGAGKSIIIDALSLVLGTRAESTIVRTGANRADITVSFDLSNNSLISQWLEDNDLDSQGECLLRRTVRSDGRSKGFINGYPATLGMLKSLGEQLVDIHGQHAHQALLRPGMQIQLLDNFAELSTDKNLLKEQWNLWQALNKELIQLKESEKERRDRLELLDYQVSELDEFGIDDTEIKNIDEEFNRLANTNQLIATSEEQQQKLYQAEQGSAFEIVNSAAMKLNELSSVDPNLVNIAEVLESASIQIQEASIELRSYQEGLDQDPQKLAKLDQRLSQLHALARKHRVEVYALPELYLNLQKELSMLKESKSRANQLEADVINAKNKYLKVAKKLSKKRHDSAIKLNKAVTDYLSQLGMKDGQFKVDFIALDESQYNASGTEKVSFLVSANSGQALQSISKVASGGELSRISLAIQVVTATGTSIPCLIFDEVDVGIGGGTAEVVGNLLRSLSQSSQVLCVTHQAQVASKAQQHYLIQKQSEDNSTTTQVKSLNHEQRTEEIARMIGGIKITEKTRKHAEEMLADYQ